jgi:hypothetical protein
MIKYHPKSVHDIIAVEIGSNGEHLLLCKSCAHLDPKLKMNATLRRFGGLSISIEYLDSLGVVDGEICRSCMQEIERFK